MDTFLKNAVALLGVFLLAGCAAQRYHAAPLNPGESALRFESRRLADSGLQSFVEKNLGHAVSPWPPENWDLRTLSLAGLYFNPALESVRARVFHSQAAIVTAGSRPNPTLGITPGIPTPYLLTLDFAFPIETAGKRGHRIQIARSLDHIAELDLADFAWSVRNGVRIAFLNYMVASRTLELFRTEEQIRKDQLTVLEQIFSVGEIPRLDVDVSRIELLKMGLAIATAEGQIADARAALAAAIGIPLEGLQNADFIWPEMEVLPNAQSLLPRELQRDAVLNRLDVRRALEEYATSEASLQLEISKQYPDINIGPGYTYEETHSFLTLGLSAAVPIFNRNQGPIAEAEARRKEAAARFLEKQAQAIARSDRALNAYKAALEEVARVESVEKIQNEQIETAQRAIGAGGSTRLSLDTVVIQGQIVARTRLDVLGRAQRALGELEDAIQRPVGPEHSRNRAPTAPSMVRDSNCFINEKEF